jgi:hypothetical protein
VAFAAARAAPRSLLLAGLAVLLLAALANAWLGGYHAGVEWKFWEGPTDCSGPVVDLGSAGTLLQRLDSGKMLSPSSRAYLMSLMERCKTGKNRMRALLPAGTKVEHKTGTLNNYTSDVGFITLPDGRRLAVAFFGRGGSDRPATIAWAARTIYDGFARTFLAPIAQPFTRSFGTAAIESAN